MKLFRIRLQGRFRTVRRVVLIHLVNMGEAVTLLEPRRYLWQASSGAFWRLLLLPRRRATWPLWKASSQKMLSPTQMAVDLCAQRESQFLVGSG